MNGGIQLALDFEEFVSPQPAVGASHAERWAAVKEANPWLVQEFLKMAHQAVARGHSRIGVKWLTEIYRWERSGRRHVSGDSWKWNNNYTSFLARDLINAEPELGDYIRTRKSKACGDE